MSYKIENLEFSDACAKISEYEYALLYMISEVILTRTDSLKQIDWNQCMEARFFSRDKELHFFESEGNMKAVNISDGDGQNEVVKQYDLANKFQTMGKSVFVKEYLDYDEDGQANVVLTRLQGIK